MHARPLTSLATEHLWMKAWGWQPLPKTHCGRHYGGDSCQDRSQLASLLYGSSATTAMGSKLASLVLQAGGETLA